MVPNNYLKQRVMLSAWDMLMLLTMNSEIKGGKPIKKTDPNVNG